MNIHEKYLNRCIELAKNGLGLTYPNPMVGAVIVCDNKIIGEGWHQKAGEPHAEVHAINAVKQKELLKKSTIYVSLEPCSHHGKTPPCSDLIAKSKIPNVVIGAIDTNSLVAGMGVEYLKKNGCNIVIGILEQECIDLNKRFYTYHNKKRPFVVLKWATSADGFFDVERSIADFEDAKPTWITNNYSQQVVHRLRATEQAILVGTETVIKDNPSLNVRTVKGNNPIRIVLDKSLRIPLHYKVFNGTCKTILITDFLAETQNNYSMISDLKIERIDFKKEIASQIAEVLCKNEIQSVMVEGGKQVLESFLDANYWDEAYVFTGAIDFTSGLKSPVINYSPSNQINILGDTLSIYKNLQAI